MMLIVARVPEHPVTKYFRPRVLRYFARGFAWVVMIGAVPVSAQLPASGTLSDRDWPLFRAEVARVEKLLSPTPDKATMTYEMARTWAFAKQWPEAMDWLRKLDLSSGIDPSRDSVFADLRGTREFQAIADAARAATPPVSHSRAAFQVPEGDLVPENLAYDPRERRFYFGSMRKGMVLRCSRAGVCDTFADGPGVVLGLKVFGGGLWVLDNKDRESALVHYDLASRQSIRRYPVTGAHNFNDLAIARSGEIYLTDTRAGVVWNLKPGATELIRIPGKFDRANGIAISPDGRLLYVSAFPEGLLTVDLKTNTVQTIPRPDSLCLATIDGLYFHKGSLIAIQNAFLSPRVVRLHLTPDLHGIDRFEVPERRNPLFDGVTTGVIVGNEFFYMANIQDEKKTGYIPITILKLPL